MNEFKGLIASVATSSNLNKENAGFQTPRIRNISKGLLESGAHLSKFNNANTGFVTPVNKNNLSGKTLFSDKRTSALGDRKNTAYNTITPLKSGNVFAEKTEKTKENIAVQLATPNFENTNISFVPASTLQPPTSLNGHSKNVLDEWNQNLVLSDEQFNLLFMEPTEKNAPPTPPPKPEIEYLHPYVEWSYVPCDYNNYDTGDGSDDLPSINVSFTDASFLN